MALNIDVVPISPSVAMPWILQKHYAKRSCPISYAFGAYRGAELVGICTYGTPMSAPLREGVCGPEFASAVLELNRLCCENEKNVASILVGRSLKMLPKPAVVVSYADTAQGHVGYVYQATNFIYTGLSAKRTDWKIKGQEHLHGGTVADKSRGAESRIGWMRETFGDDFYLKDRPRKHRYVYFVGSKADKKRMRECLRYEVEQYPKGESLRYELGAGAESQMRLIV